MGDKVKVGVIICGRYRNCAAGKCFRAAREKEGAFAQYGDREVEVVGFTTCGGCPGGNVEYTPEEMKKNGAEVIHLATCLVVGYPPCNNIRHFSRFIKEKYGMDVVVGTHPIPKKYHDTHETLETWKGPAWQEILKDLQSDEATRLAYN